MGEDLRALLVSAARGALDDPIIIIGYLEHQLDLQGKILHTLAEEVKASGVQLSPALQTLLDLQNQFVSNSSVDFDNMTDQMQSYKIPRAIEKKARTRRVQMMYLLKQKEEGML